MRLREREKQRIILCDAAPDGDRYSWKPGIRLRAVLRPGSSRVLTAMYGERAARMLLMLYDGGHWLELRQGVCVEAGAGESCDYRIVGLDRWGGHQAAHLEWIPEDLRGPFGAES